MPWVKFDDRYRLHRKIRPLNDRLWRLATEAIMWSASEENLTDGRIEHNDLTDVRPKATTADAAALVARGIWHTANTPCSSEACPPATDTTGWRIHDYFDYQPSRAKVIADRAAKAERQRNWMARRRGIGPSSNASTGASANASHGPPQDALLDPAPSPPRPAPKGSGEGTSPKHPPPAERRDGPGDGRDDEPHAAHPPPSNGAPTQTAERRAELAAAARAAARRPRPPPDQAARRDAMAELRALTPEVPVPEDPGPPTPTPNGDPG